ncbi:MAG: dicarboxylate/amino acid:cation symporter [Bacteroidaceae bacterium]|nr:dicarboxylate/amino acid:cation symporter [Bacteroidaceae bacterium]
MKRFIYWTIALLAGVGLGVTGIGWVTATMTFIATVYTRVFQLLAVPTIILTVILTLASFGRQGEMRHIFLRALGYTLATTFVASAVGLALYLIIKPGLLPLEAAAAAAPTEVSTITYTDHLLSVVPDNVVRPFLEGNVLSLLLLAFAVGLALSRLPENESRRTLISVLQGLQDVLFLLIRGLIWTLPLGIAAFAAQLSAQLSSGVAVVDAIGQYVLVIVGGNIVQIFVVLPLFLLARGLNPVRTFLRMMPAVITAFFTKSSAATLPVTMRTAEERLGVSPQVSRFVLPLCTTINMNGCSAFILVTSFFVMQHGGVDLTWPTLLLWLVVSVVAAVGNAGVPMGCYFLTLSLMAGMGMPLTVMGVILPIYTLLDMLETAENVWSDSCVAAMTNIEELKVKS